MHSYILQDWLTIKGVSTASVVQPSTDWLDLANYQDVVAWIDVRESSGTPLPTLYLETAPTKDDALFVSMNGTVLAPTGYSMTASAGPIVAQLFMMSAPTPLARYLRWRIAPTASTNWDTMFRILIAANAPGV